jgi:hypothetical protein
VKHLAITLSTAIIILTALLSCSEGITEPEKKIKHPREMTWTVDTLQMPKDAIQVFPYDIVVLSPKDVWLATWLGHGAMMHYDGKTWSMVKEIGGGISRVIEGNNKDIWTTGYIGSGFVEEFIQLSYFGNYRNGIWTDYKLNTRSQMLGLTKDDQGNIWGGGRDGIIIKYDGTQFIVDTIKLNLGPETSYFLSDILYHQGKIHALVWSYNRETHAEIHYYIHGTLKNWQVVETMEITMFSRWKWGIQDLYVDSSGELYSSGQGGVWKREQDRWNPILQLNYGINEIFSLDEKYMFALGGYSLVFFYNGTNWENISDLFKIKDPTISFQVGWTDGYETFIVGYGELNGNLGTYIFHGK